MTVIYFQNTTYYGTICAVWNSHTPSRSAMPSISKLQKLVEAAWAQGFDVQVWMNNTREKMAQV